MKQAEVFDQLLAIDKELEKSPELDSSLNVIGLQLEEPLKPGGYYCSPKNFRCFAHTGGNGTHFSEVGRIKRR